MCSIFIVLLHYLYTYSDSVCAVEGNYSQICEIIRLGLMFRTIISCLPIPLFAGISQALSRPFPSPFISITCMQVCGQGISVFCVCVFMSRGSKDTRWKEPELRGSRRTWAGALRRKCGIKLAVSSSLLQSAKLSQHCAGQEKLAATLSVQLEAAFVVCYLCLPPTERTQTKCSVRESKKM